MPAAVKVDWKSWRKQIAIGRRYLKDINNFPAFCEMFLKIQTTEGGELLPFILNPIQNWFVNEFIIPPYENGQPTRVVILKCRQTGMSTLAEALCLWCTLGHFHWNSLVIGKDEEQTRTLFRMMRRYDRHMDDADGEHTFPEFPKRKDTEDSLEYQQPAHRHKKYQYDEKAENYFNAEKGRPVVFLDSRIEVKSGEKKDVLGRGGTYHFVHASEVSTWPALKASLASLLSCCHPKRETVVICETTANGMNEFHSFWQNMQIGELEVPSLWQKFFIPWYWDARYELPLHDIEWDWLDEYEKSIYWRILGDKTLEKIDPKVDEERVWAKIFWRRQMIRDVFFGDVDLFKQEFPATEAEAFMFTGISAYTAQALDRISQTVCDPIWRGDIEIVHGPKQKADEPPRMIKRHENAFGKLKVWEAPQKEHQYAVAADIAEGKATEGLSLEKESKSKWDFSCAQVFKVTSYPPRMEQVAVWHGNSDPDVFGDTLVALALTYHSAFLSWEVNGPGISLRTQIVEKHRYRHIYLRQVYDSLSKRMTLNPGWRTARRTKPDMVAASQRFVRQDHLLIKDAGTYLEMKAYSQLGHMKYGAAQGHDDRVDALCQLCITVEDRITQLKERAKLKTAEEIEDERRKDPNYDWSETYESNDNFSVILGTEW
jgi:hypothetical protein